MIEHIEACIKKSMSNISKLTNSILEIEGMSSYWNRHLLNNIIAGIENVNYLEIGIAKGSTFISALYGNEFNSAYAVDSWIEGKNREAFIENTKKYGLPKFELIEEDSFCILPRIKHKINVYFYDGDHSVECTAKGLTYFKSVLSGEFVFIVDDYDWWQPEAGVIKGLEEGVFKVLYEKHLNSLGVNDKLSWWNGLYVSILKNEGI